MIGFDKWWKEKGYSMSWIVFTDEWVLQQKGSESIIFDSLEDLKKFTIKQFEKEGSE